MEPVNRTWVYSKNRPLISTNSRPCLVNIYPVTSAIGMRYILSENPILIGRGEECEISINDNSVSRRHARIEPIKDEYTVIDLNSTNGTFINDLLLTEASTLKDGDYLRVGNCIYRYLAGGNIEAEYHEEIYRLTIIDALTQVYNHRYLMEYLDRELLRCTRYQRPLSLVMFDVDRFKSINDQYGHLGGDFALRELASIIHKLIRREDLFARYGGEEFALILIESGLSIAIEVAERIRRTVERHPFRFEDKVFNITVSMGIAELHKGETISPHEMVRRADDFLFKAKRNGRNQVVYQ